MKMAVGAVKMQPPPAESPEPAAPGVWGTAGAPGGRQQQRQRRRGGSPGAPEQPLPQPLPLTLPQEQQLRHRLRDLPALLRSGLTLRRKRSAGGGGRALTRRISNPYLEHTASQIYGENSSCAGRALRNIFIVQASDLIKDRVNLKGVYRRSCVGSELVDWLLENCPFIQCRSMAVGVWQLLLDMGIILSVDQQLYFQDNYVFYQFSSDECSYLYCEFERAEEWQNGVRLLLQLVPLIPSRVGDCDLSHQKIEGTEETSDEILVRLTSAVQRELAAVIAIKARKAALDRDEESGDGPTTASEDDGLSDSQAGVLCKLQERDDLGRLELVQKLTRENCPFLQPDRKEPEQPDQQDDEVATLQVKEEDGTVLVFKKVSSCGPAPAPGSAHTDWRYVVVSGTPEKILEHLLNDLHLEEVQDKETETLLDDFLLTYTVFMTTDDLCQALLRHYSAKKYHGREETCDIPRRKRKVLHLVSQWIGLYKDWLHEDEHSKMFLKTIYRNVLDDVYEYPVLEKELKELQKMLGLHRRHTVDEYSPHRKNKALFHQFSLKENWLQHRGTVGETEEIFCHVYITEHSYVSVKAGVSSTAQDILKIVAGKLQHAQDDLALVAVTFSGEKHELQPNDLAISKSLELSGRIYVYRKDLSETLSPLVESEESQQRSLRILGMNTWDLAMELMNFDWSLFNSIHEQELIYFTFSRPGSSENTVNLSLLLQRCNEVQLWVATEILLCSQLCKRVQLVKKFIKIAAHCKAQRNLNSFFAIVMGLNTASVSRLSQTWEKIPGKFKKLFSELESLTDPSLNHKAYRDAFKKMKPPKIPFMPLLLKDVTFIHEGNKTFLDNLVNFEKLHMIADTVRSLRHCRNSHFGGDVSPKEHQELRSYVHHLHVIDNQQVLFELSHRIEPRA
ncbi:rap guanine nucleotide exchange factor 5 [Monodelphis domestica]|uniref:rap guanine nucleotide exchange factor 5 n=1 Tax=Monodelphis domestica TaxID=13616 RepID=UPI0024E1FAFA|nr:rap guanine nucleotide exchange factor 5 [Monodelphis domestica]